jgi:hypothetical protein
LLSLLSLCFVAVVATIWLFFLCLVSAWARLVSASHLRAAVAISVALLPSSVAIVIVALAVAASLAVATVATGSDCD